MRNRELIQLICDNIFQPLLDMGITASVATPRMITLRYTNDNTRLIGLLRLYRSVIDNSYATVKFYEGEEYKDYPDGIINLYIINNRIYVAEETDVNPFNR